jgi:hypothetical protein
LRIVRDRGVRAAARLWSGDWEYWESAGTAVCEVLFQFFRPVGDNAQTAALGAAAQHDEPPIAGHIVVRNRDVLAEVVFVSKEGSGFPNLGLAADASSATDIMCRPLR